MDLLPEDGTGGDDEAEGVIVGLSERILKGGEVCGGGDGECCLSQKTT